MMLKVIIYSLAAFFLVAGAVYYFYNDTSGSINVYGSEYVKSIDREGSLHDLLQAGRRETVNEIIIKNNSNKCMVIKPPLTEDYKLQRNRRNWDLITENEYKTLTNITSIYVDSSSEDFGVYHLADTDEKRFYCSYQLVRSSIYVDEPGASTVLSGTIDKPVEMTIENIRADSVLFVYENGTYDYQQVSGTGELLINTELLFSDNPGTYSRIPKAVWEYPPEHTAYQIHDLIIDLLEERKTIAVFIDGLGYKLWQEADRKGFTNTFPGMEVKPMRVVYPPQTAYNYYTFGTGELLHQAGCPPEKLFNALAGKDINGIIIEGEMQMYDSHFEQKLHARPRREDDIDRQIFETVMEVMTGYDFVFVHFHEIDDRGHRYGPYSEQVMQAVKRTGDYLSEIINNWDGNIVVFSDHGMHTYFDSGVYAGRHYTAKAEDIIGVFALITEEKSRLLE